MADREGFGLRIQEVKGKVQYLLKIKIYLNHINFGTSAYRYIFIERRIRFTLSSFSSVCKDSLKRYHNYLVVI